MHTWFTLLPPDRTHPHGDHLVVQIGRHREGHDAVARDDEDALALRARPARHLDARHVDSQLTRTLALQRRSVRLVQHDLHEGGAGRRLTSLNLTQLWFSQVSVFLENDFEGRGTHVTRNGGPRFERPVLPAGELHPNPIVQDEAFSFTGDFLQRVLVLQCISIVLILNEQS